MSSGEALLMNTHNMFSWRNRKTTAWIPPLIWCYELMYIIVPACMVSGVHISKSREKKGKEEDTTGRCPE